MPVSPADFALWARATGSKYPETAEEKIAAAPHAYEYAKNLGRTGQNAPRSRVGGSILYNSPESVQNQSPNSVFNSPVTPDNRAPKVAGTLNNSLTSQHFVNQEQNEATDRGRQHNLIDTIGKTALAAGTVAAGIALARNPGVQQAVRNAGSSVYESAQDIGSRVSGFLGGFGGNQTSNPAVERNSGDITPPTTSQQYHQSEIPGLSQFMQANKTAQAPVQPFNLTQSDVISTSQTFSPNNQHEQLNLITQTPDPWTREYTPGPKASKLTQAQRAELIGIGNETEYVPPHESEGGNYMLRQHEQAFPVSPEVLAARRANSIGEPNPSVGTPLVDPFTGEIKNPEISVPGYTAAMSAAPRSILQKLAEQGLSISGAEDNQGRTQVFVSKLNDPAGTEFHVTPHPLESHADPRLQSEAMANMAQARSLLEQANVHPQEALDYINNQFSGATTAAPARELYPLPAASAGERAENFLQDVSATAPAPQSSVYDVTQSSAARFLGAERAKIATQLMNEGQLVTPTRVEIELANRLGPNASQYGSKYTARRQGLELYAQTGDPTMLNKLQRFGLAPATYETFETMPAGKKAAFEAAKPFSTDYYPSEEVSPVGLRSNITVNIPGEGPVSLASIRRPVITESTALAAENYVQNARQKNLDWLAGIEKEVAAERQDIFNDRRERAHKIGTGLNAQLAEAHAAGDIGRAEQLQASLEALRNIYKNPELSMHREGEMRRLSGRLAGARRSTEANNAAIQKKFPTTIVDWSGEAKRIYGEVDPNSGEGELLPGTVELRSERKMKDTANKGGGGRNIAEYTAGEALQEEVRRLQNGGRMRDYDETGAPAQHWSGDNTQTGREIDIYGIRPSSERRADPGLRPSTPKYSSSEIAAEAVRIAEADPYGDVPIAPAYEDVIESLGKYQGSRTRQQRMRAADISDTIRKIHASGRPTAHQEVQSLLSSLASQEGTQVPSSVFGRESAPRVVELVPSQTIALESPATGADPFHSVYREGARGARQLPIPGVGFGQTSSPDKTREVVRQAQLNDLLAKYTGRSMQGALQGAMYTQPSLF